MVERAVVEAADVGDETDVMGLPLDAVVLAPLELLLEVLLLDVVSEVLLLRSRPDAPL